ncbi:hypothetical protein H6503_03380 [Candidatus Woesearchaeota archaeon]|nr:hypothetical protein [Candidatus Woesearchaeota archaeon]
MDSYEKIRKMGEISEQLKRHGLVADSEEALKQAEEVMKGQGNEFYVSKDEANQAQKDRYAKLEKEKESSYDDNRIISILNDKLASFDSQLGLMRDKMNEIIAKINELESKFNNQAKQEIQATLVQKNEKVQEKVVSSAPQQPEPENTSQVVPEVKKNYSPEDVSVDKMFYVGKK